MSLPFESDIYDIKNTCTYTHTYIQPSIHITLLLPYLKSDYLIYYNPSCCPLDNRWPLADVCYSPLCSHCYYLLLYPPGFTSREISLGKYAIVSRHLSLATITVIAIVIVIVITITITIAIVITTSP